MWGVKAVFYAAVLVCLIGSSFAVDCNGNGVMGADECICKSGFNPIADQCAAVLNKVDDKTCVGQQVQATVADHFPSLAFHDASGNAVTTFTGNTLHARIDGQYVAERQYTSLKFTPLVGNTEDTRCNLGTHRDTTVGAVASSSGFWVQNPRFDAASVTCNDTFQLDLPWNSHVACGFANDTRPNVGSNSEYLVLTGYLAITYTDKIGEVENFTLYRTTKVPYSVSVKFQKHVKVDLQALNISSNVKFGMALTEDVYDPTSGILTLQLTTIVNYPNMFLLTAESLQLFHPDQVLLQKVYKNTGDLCMNNSAPCSSNGAGDYVNALDFYAQDDLADSHPGCPPSGDEDSVCQQLFTFKAKVNPNDPQLNCSFDGTYKLQVYLYTCRGVGSGYTPSCTNQAINITWTIQGSDICGVIGVTPSVTGYLYAYPPTVTGNFRDNVADRTNDFKLGSFGHFYARIDSDSNIISLNFTEIKFQTGTDTAVYLFQKGSAPSKYVTIYDVRKYFRVEFHSSIFRVNPNSQLVYTFSATADVSFQGNDGFIDPLESRKRTIEYTWTQASAEATTTAFIRNEEAAAPVAGSQAGVSSVTFIASVVGAVAGTMIIVFVVVGFALRSRSSNKDESSASLIAASAAAAEIANRA